MASKHLTLHQRNSFKRIMAQLERTRTDKGVLKVIAAAQALLDEVHVGWDAIQLYLPSDYVFKNQRKASVKVATVLYQPGAHSLGRDGRALLKQAIVRHADWPVIKETLGIDMSHTTVEELIAIAQLLKLDDRFIQMFLSHLPDPNAAPDRSRPSYRPTPNGEVKDLEEILADQKNGKDHPSE